MATLNYVLRDPTTGLGLPGQAVYLRIGPGFASNTHALSDVVGKPGAYQLSDLSTFAAGEYELWVNGVKDNSFGRRELYKLEQLLLKSGGTMTGNFEMGGNKITGLNNPVDAGEPVNKGYGDTTYLLASLLVGLADLASVQTFTGTKTFGTIKPAQFGANCSMAGWELNGLVDPTTGSAAARRSWVEAQIAAAIASLSAALAGIYPDRRSGAPNQDVYAPWTYRLTPYIISAVTSPFHAANVKFVKDYVNSYLTGSITNYQQTESLIRVSFNGTQEDNRLYATIQGALNRCNSESSALLRMVMLIEGSGNDDGSLLTNYNLLPTGIEDYVDIIGVSQSVVVRLEDDTYSTPGALGRNIIDNVTLNNDGDDATSGFTNWVFVNVKFTGDNYNLTDCILLNCTREDCIVNTSGCLGSILDITNSQEVILHKLVDETGAYEISYPNGDICGRRLLGREGSPVASDTDIELGNGNYFVITGTTNIEFIHNTGWTDGSVITLDFSDTLNLISGSAGFDEYAGILTNTGANKAVGGKVLQFVLTGDGTMWKELH